MSKGIEIARRAKEQLTELTDLRADTVSRLMKTTEGWQVDVEMIEMKRIPDSSDVLATYETTLDDEGNVLNYRRTRRYYRADAMETE